MDKKEFIPKLLPLDIDIETKKILKKTVEVRASLSALNQVAKTIPNQNILINSLTLQEAKDSSEIENIITTHDELYRSEIDISNLTHATKEVKNYQNALMLGYNLLQKNNLLLQKDIIAIQNELEQNNAGLRKLHGTVVKNIQSGEIRLKPLQNHHDIVKHLDNFINYMNYDLLDDIGPLVKMAILHFTLEAIHPFYDGNGRTGRIINLLYIANLMKEAKHSKIYTKDLIEAIFYHPYIKIDFLENYLKIHRVTASKYLNNLEKIGILKGFKIGRSKYFINLKLFELLKKDRS